MVTLKLLNAAVEQKIIDQLNRIRLTKKYLVEMKKNVHYIYSTPQQHADALNSFVDFINFSQAIYDRAITQAKLFNTLNINAFSSRTIDHEISQDQIDDLNELLDTAIKNAETNEALIEENFKNEDFEKIANKLEEKRNDLENHIQSLADTVTQLELQARDETTVDGLKSKEVVEIARICDEMHEIFFEESQKPSNVLIAVFNATKQMADIQRALIKSIAQA